MLSNDYLKSSIVKFILYFLHALGTNVNWYDDDKYQIKHLCIYNETIQPL